MNNLIERSITHHGGGLYVRDHSGICPAIVGLHGFPDDSRIYNRLIGLLAPRRVVTFDWMGYGHSTRRESTQFATTDRQRELLAVLDGLELEQVVLVGHDAGGPEAVDFAVRHPQRVAHLVLLNCYYGRNGHFRPPEMIALMADARLTPLTDALVDHPDQRLWLLRHTARRFGLDESVPPDGIAAVSIVPQFFGDSTQPDAMSEIRAWTADLPRALDGQDAMIASGQLRSIRVPVSVIFGRDDLYLNPDVAQAISGSFANSQLHLLDQASHWPQWDQPQTVAGLINRAIATIAATPRANAQNQNPGDRADEAG